MSIDATANPEEIFRKEKSFLIQKGFEIVEEMRLEPFDKDHEMILCYKIVFFIFKLLYSYPVFFSHHQSLKFVCLL